MRIGRLGTGINRLGSLGNPGSLEIVFDPDALALFDRMTVPPDDARKAVINTLIVALKTAGVWPLLDRLLVLAAHDQQAALLNWKAATTTPLISGSVNFQADRGFTGNGIDGRIQSRYNPNINGVNYTLNDASLWIWNRTASLNSVVDVGNLGSPNTAMCVLDAAGNIQIAVNEVGFVSAGSPSSVGLSGGSRIDMDTVRAWRNGVQLGPDLASTSVAMPDTEQWICGGNNSSFSDRQIAAAAWGASLTGRELAFYNAMLNYMTAVGAA